MNQQEPTEHHGLSQDDTNTATPSNTPAKVASTMLERALQEIADLKSQVQSLNDDVALMRSKFPTWFEPERAGRTFYEMSYESSTSVSLTEMQESSSIEPPGKRTDQDRLPIMTLAVAGGLTLVVGALLFIWKAKELGWIEENTRLMIVGVGALAMLLMAPNTRHRVAAQGLGGAGLGTWFAVWLVAHFVHEVDLITTLVGLMSASTLCLVVAEHKNLRLMANVGALSALSTPIFILFRGRNSLTELMISLFIIMTALVLLEHRVGARVMGRQISRTNARKDAESPRRWPELGHMGMIGTWVSIGIVAFLHPDWSTTGELLLWIGVFLVATGVQTLLLRTQGVGSIHAVSRHVIGGLAAWVMAAFTLSLNPASLGWATQAMAVWHLWIFWWSLNYGRSALLHGSLVVLAWLQIFAFGPLNWSDEHELMVTWWLVQALGGATMTRLWPKWHIVSLVSLPLGGTLIWAFVVPPDTEALRMGLCGVALLVGVTLTPAQNDARSSRTLNHLTTVLLPLAAVIGGFLASKHITTPTMSYDPGVVTIVIHGVIAALGTQSVLHRTDDRPQVKATLLVVLIGLAWIFKYVEENNMINATGPDAHSTRLALALIAMGFGALGIIILYCIRCRSTQHLPPKDFNHDVAGILVIGAIMLSLQMLASSSVHLLPSISSDRANEACISALIALGAIASMVAGLRHDRKRWVAAAWGGLLIACTKTLAFDTSIPGIYRVLSVMGLGTCMLLSALAYERIKQRHEMLDEET